MDFTTLIDQEIRKVLNEMPVSCYETDPQGIILYANDRECEIRGRAAYELIGRPCWESLPESAQSRAREDTLQKLSGNRSLIPYRWMIQQADGTLATLETHDTILRGATGEVVGMRSVSIDVTEGANTQLEVQQTTSELRALFNAIPEPFPARGSGGQRSRPPGTHVG